MAFLDETASLLGLNETIQEKTFLYLSPKNGVVVEGHKKIYELSSSSITLLCEEKMQVVITGEDLEIKEISHREICIRGRILAVNFE